VLAALGPWHVLILLVVVVLVFGTVRFRRAFRGLKQGGKEFKRGLEGRDRLPPPDDD
jgi:TatA/E family protein of Tat protein translocase